MGNAALKSAMGPAEVLRNAPGETYYAQLKCHDPSGVSHLPVLLLLP
ncbi:MAG: hypothetical protein PWR25_860 [Euryarchaeota archaeon]|jgi:hypothetical protein|nr:hypothetical protein [Euryarchaeota archaeon]